MTYNGFRLHVVGKGWYIKCFLIQEAGHTASLLIAYIAKTIDNIPSLGCEFLSDAPIFGLSLWTELKVANCACASGWSFWWTSTSFTFRISASCWLRSSGKILAHRELEVHTVYQRFLTRWQRPTPKDISSYFACLYHVCGYRLQARIKVSDHE